MMFLVQRIGAIRPVPKLPVAWREPTGMCVYSIPSDGKLEASDL